MISVYFLAEIKCHYCGDTLPTDEELLLLHAKSCQCAARPDKSYKHVCYMCPYHTTYPKDMRRHIRTHSGEKRYKCNLCEYRAAETWNLIRHLRAKHGLERL